MVKKNKIRITALYERLSRDDEQQGESNSIVNQKRYLEEYARANGFSNIRHFTDDGYSGTNFNRPGFHELLKAIDNGEVETVIVKDMSRFGRNYLQVGMYTEIQFPNKGVRFIAVNNNVDSANPTANEFTPFLNIMNEWYAKDTSNKIKAIFHARMKEGKRCSGAVPYGYCRHPGNKQTLYIDEEAAQVVHRIFQMTCSGYGLKDIAGILQKEKILIPTAYHESKKPEQKGRQRYHDPYLWTVVTVSGILDRQEYLGHTVLGKTICENFKTKKRRKANQNELMFFPDTHEAIIDQETWDLAQKMRKRSPRKSAAETSPHRLSGLIFCADCGARMSYSSPESKHTVKEWDSNASFQCSHYKSIYENCTSHFIKASTLETTILSAVRLVSKNAIENETEFVEELRKQWDEQQKDISEEERTALSAAKKRSQELNELIRGLYEKNVKGIIPDKQFERLIAEYDGEQNQLDAKIRELEEKKEDRGEKVDSDRFVALVRKYRDFSVLTDEMLYELIDRVEVHEATGGRTRYRQQKIDVYFSFIGNYLPESAAVSEEERIAMIEEEAKKKAAEKEKRALQKTKERRASLKKAAETDPAAAEKYEAILAHEAEERKRYAERRKADPEYIARQEEKERIRAEKALEAEQRKLKRQNRIRKETRSELVERAKYDPEAAAQLAEVKAKEKEQRERKKAEQERRMAEDPAYAEEVRRKNKERNRIGNERRKERLQLLREQAETDPEAARRLAEFRAYQCDATKKSRKKMYIDAQNGDPEAIERYRIYLLRRQEDYRRKKGSAEMQTSVVSQ